MNRDERLAQRLERIRKSEFVTNPSNDLLDDVIAALRQSSERDAVVEEALVAALPYLDNSDSPGGCDGRSKECGHCRAIALVRAAIRALKGAKP